MSLRIDTAELISSCLVIGETGHGVLGADVPATGLHGASYLYNDITLPADAAKEIRGLIVTVPGAGTFFAYEDGSFSLIGAPDGAYTFSYRLYVDAVDQGLVSSTILIGVGPTLGGSALLGDMSAGGAFSGTAAIFTASSKARIGIRNAQRPSTDPSRIG